MSAVQIEKRPIIPDNPTLPDTNRDGRYRITNAVLYRLSYRGKPLIDLLTCRSGNQKECLPLRPLPNGLGRALL